MVLHVLWCASGECTMAAGLGGIQWMDEWRGLFGWGWIQCTYRHLVPCRKSHVNE